MTRELRDYQHKTVAYLQAAWSAGVRRPPAVLATGLGKGHPLETEVPTPRGWRRWGDLEIGDEVFGRDGSSTRVLEVHDRGSLPTFRVTMSDGSSVVVDGEHLWTVRDSSDARRWKLLETRVLARLELKRSRGWRFHVPMVQPLQRPSLKLPLDPYVVGALISNGSMTGSSGAQLTTPDLEVAARVARATSSVKINDATPGVCDRYYLAEVTATTRALGMRVGSLEKRVPPAYLEASLGQRTALLHGLMDGDGGGRDRSRRSVSYFTSSSGLARDVSELVTSLGGTGIVKRYDRGPKGVEYAVRILLPSNVPPFSTSRKSDAGTSSTRNLQPKRAIVSIEPLKSQEIRCIRVAARDSLYLITRQHIVTHNTEVFTDPSLLDQFLEMRKRILIIAHTDELIEQAARKARRNNPGRRVGIVKAAANQVTADIIVSSRQTLGHATGGPRRMRQMRNIGLIVIDEAHHAIRTNTYGKILDHFGCFAPTGCICGPDGPDELCPKHGNPAAQPPMVAGFTATLARGDREKLSTVWEAPPGGIFRRDIIFGIRHGFLLDVAGERVRVPDMDMSRVRQSGGDYRDGDIADELERTFAPEIIAKAYAEKAGQRKGIAFWPLVDTAYHGAKAFNEAGIRSEVIHGELPKPERRAMLARLHSGETRVVHGVGVLTEGFDEPTCDVVVVARPTRSAPLYQQMVGRVLRPDLTLAPEARGKALILDVVGAGAAHDLRSLIDLAPERQLRDADDGETLLQLDDEYEDLREQDGGIDLEPELYAGPAEVVAFDPLGRDKLWARTPGGTWFMKAGTVAYVFLVESVAGEPSHYDVVLCSKEPGWARATEYVDLPLDIALAEAEGVAVDTGGHGSKSLASKKSKWRKAPATDKPNLIRKGQWLGVYAEGMTVGELSEAIDAVQAARRVDPLVADVKAMR